MRRSAQALTVIALAACSAAPQPCETCPAQPAREALTVCVDDAFIAHERHDIDDAAKRWTDATCGLVDVTTRTVDGAWVHDDDCARMVYRVLSSYGWVQDTTTDGTLAFCDGLGGRSTWIIVDRIPNGRMADVVTHEIGHLLGVEHGATAMADPLSDSTCIDRRAAIVAAVGTK